MGHVIKKVIVEWNLKWSHSVITIIVLLNVIKINC